jgi:AraC family transcriptional regulator of adaptative response/methylated-DNA-[protein]-cysteine methyltransferase
MTPATYARGGKGARIGYTLTDSPLGRLLVAATESGVCMVCLGDDDASLEAELRHDFPEAEIERDTLVLEAWVEALVDFIRGEEPHPDLPLDVRGTAFQRRVWRELMAIPRGDTLTYGEIAERIGKPKAARAVGRACATNPVSLVVPCHRAVGANGSLTGYRWGKDRKQALLESEKEAGAV